MATTQTQAANGKKRYVNVGIKYRGFLAHDNKYFDRTCPSCGSMYDSRSIAMCPKCMQPLTSITAPSGKAMGISEGTFYPCLSNKTKEGIKQSLGRRKRAMPITYRFKIFSFPNEQGVLAPPPQHLEMKTGALIEMVLINHPAEATYYFAKEKNLDPAQLRSCAELIEAAQKANTVAPEVPDILASMLKLGCEVMHRVYPQYGDTIKVVMAPKAKGATTVSYKVDAEGNPAPVAPPYGANAAAEIDLLKKRLAEIEGQIARKEGPAPQAAAAPVAPPVDDQAFDDSVNYDDYMDYLDENGLS